MGITPVIVNPPLGLANLLEVEALLLLLLVQWLGIDAVDASHLEAGLPDMAFND